MVLAAAEGRGPGDRGWDVEAQKRA
jgi:hypothetical protein